MKNHPSRWIAGTLLWNFAALAGLAGTRFEFDQGRPVKLVWDAVAGRTYHLRETTDFRNWQPVPGFPKAATSNSLEHSFTAGNQGYYRIVPITGGGGWQISDVPPLPGAQRFQFSDISAIDSTTLWIGGNVSPVGDGCVLKTIDGGLTWNLIFRSPGFGPVNELQMVTPSTGFIAGGGLRRTTDGGVTWQFEQGNLPNPPGIWHNVGPEGYVYGLWAADPEHVSTAGYDGSSAGVIYHRVPERPQPGPGNLNLNFPWWLEWAQTYHGMYGISAIDLSTAWAVGWQGSIWKSTDGQSWTQQTSNTAAALHDVAAVSANTVWAVGDGGSIVKTTDGGATWIAQDSGTTENLVRIAAPDSQTAWAVGSNGTILHTTDGGLSWLRQFSGTHANLTGLASMGATTAWAVGADGTILRTNDGGTGEWTAPVLSSVTPSLVGAYTNGQLTVTLSGAELRGGNIIVLFNGIPSECPTWVDTATVTACVPYLAPGTYDVTVTNEDGKSGTLARAVVALPEPIVTHYSPLRGPAAGGFEVAIEGYNLQNLREAILSGAEDEVVPVTVLSPTQALFSIPDLPGRVAGKRSVVLQTHEGQSTGFRELLLEPAGGAPLSIDSIMPTTGPAQTLITVTGSGFQDSTVVWMDGNAPDILTRSSNQITFRAAGSAGLSSLTVVNDSDFIEISPSFWLTAGAAPILTQIAPASGSVAGGTVVTLTGTAILPTDTVTFGGYPAEVTSRTTSTLTVRTPAHPSGVVSVYLMPEGLTRPTATLVSAYTYQ